MSMVAIGAALIGGAASLSAAQQGANAQESALNQAGAQTRQGIRAQTAATGQQLELARPLIQTRDNALRALQTLFGLPQTAPSQIAASPGFGGTSGQQLVSLPGVRVVDQTKKGDKTAPADLLGAFSKPGRSEISSQAFYDPARRVFVDETGAVVDAGQLTHGSDNKIRVGPDGKLYSVGNRGETEIGTLPTVTAGQGINEADGSTFIPGSATNPSSDRQTLIDTLMNTPGIRFVDDQGRKELEQMLAARGLRRSGAGYVAGIRRASDLASTNYSNLVLNPLFQLAGFGQQGANAAGNALGQAGQNATQNAGTLANLALQSGNARASSYQQTGQAIGDLASNLAYLYERRGQEVPKTGTVTATKPAPITASPNFVYRDPLAPNSLYDNTYGGN